MPNNEQTTNQENTKQEASQAQSIQQTKTVGNDYQNSQQSQISGVTVIGIGQGGCSIGYILEKGLRKLTNVSKFIAINTAQADLNMLDISEERKFLIGGSGAGKDRKFSKQIFFETDDIFNNIVANNKNLFFGRNQIILVVFSANGGTGSGIANKFMLKLSDYCANTKENFMEVRNGKQVSVDIEPYRPTIVGVCITPDIESSMESGIDSLQNTLECMTEIDKIIKAKAGSYFIIKNKLDKGENIYKTTNKNVVEGFEKFLKALGVSKDNTILDARDRFKSLSLPGLMAFADLNNINRYNMLTPTIGSRVASLVAELSYSDKDGYNSKLSEFSRFSSNYIIEDSTLGWNDINLIPEAERSKLRSDDILLLAGFSNLDAILEPIKNALDRKIRAAESVNIEGNAFNGLEESIEKRVNQKKKATAIDLL